MPPPTPSFYCSKNVYPNFFLKLTTCLTPDQGKNKMKNQNYVKPPPPPLSTDLEMKNKDLRLRNEASLFKNGV
jgi:hypothetical protein